MIPLISTAHYFVKNHIVNFNRQQKSFIELLNRIVTNKHQYRVIVEHIEQVYGVVVSDDHFFNAKCFMQPIDKTLGIDLLGFINRCSIYRRRKANNSTLAIEIERMYTRMKLPRWGVKDGRLIKLDCERYGSKHVVTSSRLTNKEKKFWLLIKTIDDLLLLETFYPSQKFLKYFNVAEFLTMGMVDGFPVLSTSFVYPTLSRTKYLLWKNFLSDFCEYSTYEKTELFHDVIHWHYLLGSDLKMTAEIHKEIGDEIKSDVWRKKWNINNLTWQAKIKMPEGFEEQLFIHEHELPAVVRYADVQRTKFRFPSKINISPKVFFHEAYLLTLAKKTEAYQKSYDFLTLDQQQILPEWRTRIVPIKNNFDLIREGSTMKHCIGGEDYLESGIKHEKIYFRFIPQDRSPTDLENGYTVTLSKCEGSGSIYTDPSTVAFCEFESNEPFGSNLQQVDPSMGGCLFLLSEAWGYKNKQPKPQVMREIYQFLYDNRNYLMSFTI